MSAAAVPDAAAEIMADELTERHRRERAEIQHMIGGTLTNLPPADGAPHTADTPEAARAAELVAARPNRYAASRLDIVELIKRGPPPADWLLEPILARGRVHALVAKGGAGKSLLALIISASLAVGIDPFTGRAITPLRVLYIDHEMTQDDIYERLEDLGFLDPKYWELLGENLAYYQLPDVDPLDTQPGADELIALAHEVKPDLLMVDTLSRVIQGPENDADTFNTLYRLAWQPLKGRGITIVRLDHTGHEHERARGSSAKDQDADVVWSMKATDEETGWLLKNLKKRMGWIPNEVPLAKVQGEALTIRRVHRSWAEGTAEAASMLDTIGWPIDGGRGNGYRQARAKLAERGLKARDTAALCDALAFRRSESYRQDDPSDLI